MKQRFVKGKKAAFHDLVDTLKTYCELSLDYFMIGERPDVTNYAADILNKDLILLFSRYSDPISEGFRLC